LKYRYSIQKLNNKKIINKYLFYFYFCNYSSRTSASELIHARSYDLGALIATQLPNEPAHGSKTAEEVAEYVETLLFFQFLKAAKK
jgi:hypothetical protein